MEAIHPGEHSGGGVERDGDERGGVLARQIGVAGPKPRHPDSERTPARSPAIRPCGWRTSCATSAEFWLNLQSLYELRLARQKSGSAIKLLSTIRATLATHPELA